jgi:hypothetical protein
VKSKRDFNPEQYRNLSQDHLVVAALSFLADDGKQTSFENLVAEAFSCFPERFQLEGYPDWPNAHVVGKSWVRCRTDKKWITGSASEGFKLTPLGLQIAEQVIAGLEPTASDRPRNMVRRGSRQTISSRVVLRVENSSAYKKLMAGLADTISEYEFCELLYCTLESTPDTFEKNFSVIQQELSAYGRKDLVNFLQLLRNKFENRFTRTRVRGGLMPQKKES